MNTTAAPLRADRVLAIAQADAERAYRDLSRYMVRISQEEDGWHVDYELKGEAIKGGGPHYLIDPDSGEILRKRYEQ